MDFEVIEFADRDEWLAKRRQGIGASDAAGVLGISPWSSPVSVFADKVLGESKPDSEPMMWGRKLEPVILAHFAEEAGREVAQDGRLLRSTRWPWMTCTLDGTQTRAGRMGTVEVKNTRFRISDGVPEHYWVQMQHQLAVTGLGWGSFAALVMGCEFVWCDVQRDEEFITRTLVPACEAFWKRVENGGPTPAADPSQATLDALKRIYPTDNGGTVDLPAHFCDLDMERQKIAAELAELEGRKRGIDNEVKAAIGDASVGLLTNGRAYTWKANKNGVRTIRAPLPEEEF